MNFVKTIATADMIRGTRAPAIDVEAPEFTYQIDLGPQQSIPSADAQTATLLVLYTLPQSRGRLLALATAASDLARSAIRVVAIPLHSDAASTIEDLRMTEIAATASPGLAETYRLLGRNVAPANREHLEFLIDRDGRLRARWDAGGVPPAAFLVQQVRRFDAEGQRAPRRTAHQRGH